ncbi:DHH family phosphoesterase [Mycoplasmoides genitalium]|uniref:DHH family phosphoesterase n=1 Tax=Mycoplasmoides genitalium TaxID=2097 RepID=D5FY51_MYCGT|nr:DHH family phosphoesterase [Mycoplasmoides genitalium]ACZ50053.1 DHH family phosphoesterase [Mycoplasmoides genitalium]ADJ67823.1 DHH family phosphoesterase [Mycoplasmoides genitalium]ADJ67829.1 DHH family phosphoesterase [Mycoplasmoides genitalium]
MKKGSITEAINAIKQFDKIVIFHHVRPDGDCLGAQQGLFHLIKANFKDKEVKCVGNNNNLFSFINMTFTNQIDESFLKEALAIVVDANYKNRIELRELLDKKLFKAVLRIDHHPNEDDLNTSFNFVEDSYVACCEQIVEMATVAKWTIPPVAATLLYIGIYTDSNRFLYSNTSYRTLYLAAILYKAKADIRIVHDHLNHTSLADLKFKKYVYNHFKTQGQVIYFICTKKIQKRLRMTADQCARVNLLSNIADYKIWLFFIEQANNEIRIELRSNGINVRDIAIKYGGGGHNNASGAIITNKKQISDVVSDCVKKIVYN